MSDHPMDDRRHYTDSTLVKSERYGPREFRRGGQQVSCVCDPDHGIVCAYHGLLREQVAKLAPGNRQRRRRRRS